MRRVNIIKTVEIQIGDGDGDGGGFHALVMTTKSPRFGTAVKIIPLSQAVRCRWVRSRWTLLVIAGRFATCQHRLPSILKVYVKSISGRSSHLRTVVHGSEGQQSILQRHRQLTGSSPEIHSRQYRYHIIKDRYDNQRACRPDGQTTKSHNLKVIQTLNDRSVCSKTMDH